MVDHLFVQLLAKEESIGHEIVDHPVVALRVTVDSGKGGRVDDGFGATGADNLMADVSGNLGIGKAREIAVDGDALAEDLADRLSQSIVEVRLAAEDEGEAVHGIAAEVHEHLDVVEDGGGEILGPEERLAAARISSSTRRSPSPAGKSPQKMEGKYVNKTKSNK